MFGNYQEEKIKNRKEREEYKLGLDAFLSMAQRKVQAKREDFFSPENYKNNPERYRELYKKTLGFPLTENAQTPKLLSKTFVAQECGVYIYRMQLQFFDCVPFYGLYFEQTENAKNAPFVFVCHGGAGTPEVISGIDGQTWNYNDLAFRVIKRGANAFLPQFMLWNMEEYGTEYNRLYADGKLRQLGGSMTALELYFLRGALDYFIENGMVNQDKIGVAGLSYGGMYALHFSALDERVKACYSCSWVADGFDYSWADWSYFNAQNAVSTVETLALVCPRALVVGMGEHDELFDWKKTKESCEKAKAFYRAFGVEENLKVCIFNGGHEADRSEEEIDFLFKNLEGIRA